MAQLEQRRLQSDAAIGLHRADVEIAGAGMDAGAGMLFDHVGAYAVMSEESGSRQPDEAAADDKDVALHHCHRCLSEFHPRRGGRDGKRVWFQ